ncbi:hypothetical protein, partial [Klebsiella pneumoniae]|uniref:hypothetical protein n=1 Tax=Klebsiella pneumoniae TaxID=573 RepID=UPI001B3C16A0
QPAWMRAEGRVLQGRCLGPTRSLQGKVEGTAQRRCCWPEPGGTGGGGDWPRPVRSLRHDCHNAED